MKNKHVRLHDAIIMLKSQPIKQTTFGLVEFVVKDLIPKPNPDAIEPYYFLNEKGKFQILPTCIHDCLINEGIKRISTPDDEILLIKDTNNVIDPFNYRTDLLVLLKDEINELKVDRIKIENVITYELTKTIMKSLFLIKPYKLTYYKDTEYTFGLPFKNGFMLMSKDGKIIKQKYNPKNGFFHKHIIQTREFKKTDEVGDFEILIKNVSGKDFEAFMTMVGYLAHNYKNPTMSPCIVLTDENADGITRNGGRFKTGVSKALSEVLVPILKGGKEFDPNYRHVFDDLHNGTKLYIIDDVEKNFRYDDLYTNILGGINCHRKGKKAEQINFEDSPKFLITSNWVLPYSSANSSTNRRFVEYKFNNHYNMEHTPIDDFGRRLFIDWDEAEFDRFYSFIFRCVKLFFDKGLIAPIYDKDMDNFMIKFNNDGLLLEFERILKPLLASKRPFKVNDFLTIYQDYQNPLKIEKWFHSNNVKDLIYIWIKYYESESIYKNWSYSKRDKMWVFNDQKSSIKSIIEKNNNSKFKNVLGNLIDNSVIPSVQENFNQN
ncbi:MAG TPA: hypothetical protein VFS71_10325 [Flavobacterium sp.]|uniref:hypothetical protein n=1 Tax=Flavobacterium sp. TaxID=239 RepID=UPI002DBC1E40|nr:hypothetical protein [Flavobacterium sp.]HEU4790072.1 hypothetical protein [Flavobacterium sp.]